LDYLIDPSIFRFHEGFIDLPKGSGLGIEINEEKVQGGGADWPQLEATGLAQ
jgi:galactonate dehydratase